MISPGACPPASIGPIPGIFNYNDKLTPATRAGITALRLRATRQASADVVVCRPAPARKDRHQPSKDFTMSLSMHAVAVPSFLNTLGALSKILDKAAAHCAAKKIDPAALLTMRLYPDMFTLTKQVQLTSDFAKNTIGRLTGEPPKFPDTEQTFDELKGRIAKTVDYVKSFQAGEIDATADKDVTFPIGPQQTMTLKGAQYLVGFALPNFYFHATTAYDILRHAGVELGKRDFLGRS
jgi:uncharacterized protein